MSKKFKTISLIILVAFLTIILGIIPEVIGDKAKEISEYYFREKYEYFLFTFFIVGSFIVVWLTTDLKKNLSSNKYESSNKNIENEISKIRTSLKESYQDRINSKLANRYPINLKIKYSLKGTTTKAPNYINNTFGYNKIKEELHKIFEKHGGRLLMIGEAGSGKTTLLIQLALILIEKKEERIPLIINIATWRERFKTVEEWLIELLPQMGISKPLSQFLINGKRLLPLFDGLDELAKEKRKKCLEAIGEYGESNNRVCSINCVKFLNV